MRVFVTGATGFIGSATVAELVDNGHEVVGFARSDDAVRALLAAGAKVHRGDLDDIDSLRSGASGSDGVIHLAYMHRAQSPAIASAADRLAIETIGDALAGSNRPFAVTSGTALLAQGRLVTEEDSYDSAPQPPERAASERLARTFVERDVRVSIVRMPPSVHGKGDHGFVPRLIGIAREKGVSAYVEDGSNRWPAVHRLDAAVLYRLALEKAPAGACLHGIGDPGVPLRDIAEVIGRHLQLPVRAISKEEAAEHFGGFSRFVSIDNFASSAITEELLEWHATQVGLIEDLEEGHYFTG